MAATSDPAKHKSLGRQARGFNRAKWDENKLRIVEEGTWFKFTASKNAAELKKQLLETGEREIVEASPLDRIWGIGFGAKDAEANRANWVIDRIEHPPLENLRKPNHKIRRGRARTKVSIPRHRKVARKDREAAAEEKAALNRIVHPLKEDGKNDEDKEGNDGDEDDERGSALLEGFVGKIMV
ncbi:hypothetical protein Vi05172_g1600 [Venturia inaequalis]|nr:hypothetical protein Vi05172_g1600 [Venturia inaequalis]